MKKFTTGMVTGGILGAIGLTYALTDKRSRKKFVRDGKKMVHKTTKAVEEMF